MSGCAVHRVPLRNRTSRRRQPARPLPECRLGFDIGEQRPGNRAPGCANVRIGRLRKRPVPHLHCSIVIPGHNRLGRRPQQRILLAESHEALPRRRQLLRHAQRQTQIDRQGKPRPRRIQRPRQRVQNRRVHQARMRRQVVRRYRQVNRSRIAPRWPGRAAQPRSAIPNPAPASGSTWPRSSAPVHRRSRNPPPSSVQSPGHRRAGDVQRQVDIRAYLVLRGDQHVVRRKRRRQLGQKALQLIRSARAQPQPAGRSPSWAVGARTRGWGLRSP